MLAYYKRLWFDVEKRRYTTEAIAIAKEDGCGLM